MRKEEFLWKVWRKKRQSKYWCPFLLFNSCAWVHLNLINRTEFSINDFDKKNIDWCERKISVVHYLLPHQSCSQEETSHQEGQSSNQKVILQMSENCSKTKSRFLRSGWCVASHLAAIFLIFLPDLIGGVQLQIKSKHPHRHCVQSAGQVFQDCSSLYQVNDRPPSPLPPLPSSVVCDGSGFVLHHLYQGCH